MSKFFLILTISLLFTTTKNFGQCPDRDSMYKRIVYLRDSLKSPNRHQLAELLGYKNRMQTCTYANDSTHAFLLRRIGSLFYFEGDYLQALQYYRQFIDIINSNAGKPSVNIKNLVGGYYWLSVIYDSLNMVTEKLKALDNCADIADKLQAIDNANLTAIYARTEYYFDVGDYYRCIEYAGRCETLASQYAKVTSGRENEIAMEHVISSLLWRVKALLVLKDYSSAEVLLTNRINEFKKTDLKKNLGTIYGQLAELELNKNNVVKALSYFTLQLNFDRRAGYDFNCKQTWNSIGNEIYFKRLHDADGALTSYRTAFKFINKNQYRKNADVYESLNLFTNMGNAYVQKGFFDSAFLCYQFAFNQIRTGLDETDLLRSTPAQMLDHKKIHYLTTLVTDKGDACKKKYEATKNAEDLQQAISVYKSADRLLSRVKTEQSDLRSKLFWRSDSRRLYENAIDACYLQQNTTDGFYFFEKSRAVLLNDQLNEQRWMDESDILKQTQLKKIILRLEKELGNPEISSQQAVSIREETFKVKKELDRLEQAIKADNPFYYQSFLDTGFISMQYVQRNLLKKHPALLEIFSGDSAVYTLLVTAGNSYLNKINKKDFERTADQFIYYLADADVMNRDFDGFSRISAKLYKMIFGQLVLPGDRVIISPDGKYFPFEALVTSKANQPITYFLNDYAVSYTYSARFLMNDFVSGSAKKKANDFMGIAPVNFPSAFSLAALAGSDRSLYRISTYFDHAINQVAADASRNNFLQRFSQYRIIQLYTHASDTSINHEPVIYFSDSALYLSDLISEYKPLTRLVVLSACETGVGKIYRGEGVFSFNRGFAVLGIPAAITNLWSVDNGSTYLLTELFYKYLARGLSTDVALQKAKLEFLQSPSRERSMPCYWAGPVLVGKTDIIELNKPGNWKWIIFFASAAFIAVWIIWKKNLKKGWLY